MKKQLPSPIQQLIEDMITVEGGTFMMGSNAGDSDEQPVHSVTLDDFYIGKYPVTQAQWEAVMNNNPSHFKGEQNPVECVNWNDVQTFIEKLNELLTAKGLPKGYCLPTEAQWEYAARGGNHSKGYIYAGSDNIDEVAWYDKNSGDKTHPVGQKKPNELGLYDMSGNVWEWCQDWYDSDYYKNSPANNPTGPTSGSRRVLRGGSWGSYAYYCKTAYRNYISPYTYTLIHGFRLALQ